MAGKRDYASEYQASAYEQRLKRNRGIPKAVAAGKGPIPASLAKKLEKGTATAKDRRGHAKGIRAYESKYGSAGRGRPGRNRVIPRRFSTRQAALDWLEAEGMPTGDDYCRIEHTASGWKVTMIR